MLAVDAHDPWKRIHHEGAELDWLPYSHSDF
jgi:hypothetical protein